MKKFLFLIVSCITTLSVSAGGICVIKTDFATCLPQEIEKVNGNKILFYFRYNDATLDPSYMSNMKALEELDEILDSEELLRSIDTLKVGATASPEGRYQYNLKLAMQRALSFKRMLTQRYNLPLSAIIEPYASVTSWLKLESLAKNDTSLPRRSAVLDIINSNDSHAVIGWKLKTLGSGESWRYIEKNYLPYLRTNEFSIDVIGNRPIKVSNDSSDVADVYKDRDLRYNVTVITHKANFEIKEFIALKTNLLFDAASLINVEVEVPIGDRWSVAGEWIFPWWTWDKSREDYKPNRIQMLNLNLEGRYWFGNRVERPKMTGWFAGVYVGAGLYDFQYKAKGFQGEFVVMSGLSGGYAHTINKSKSLRMEYSLGVGYIKTNYQKYESCFGADSKWNAVRTSNGKYSYIGPARAKISLVWMLNRKVK